MIQDDGRELLNQARSAETESGVCFCLF